MNKLQNIKFGILAVLFTVCIASCSKEFLNEELTSDYNEEMLTTDEGLNALAVSLYANTRYHFAYEWAYGTTQYGCDEFSTGTDLTSEPWNIYDSRLGAYTFGVNANTPKPENMWDQMYYGINSCNLLISKADLFVNQDLKNKCLGEAYFLRGYNYLRLVMQYGGVVLKLTPTLWSNVERYYERSSVEDCVASIISDLQNAYALLSDAEWRGEGTFTKSAAAHFLAKAMLFRCSERNNDWNTTYKTTDLDSIISSCDYVISKRPLAPDYRTLWNYIKVDGENERSSEIILAAQFNADASTAGRYENRTFCYFATQFSNYCGGWVKRGQWIGLDFQRCRPTQYNYDVFDKVNDSRFWKSFKTTYGINVNTAPARGLSLGDMGIMFIVNDINDTRFDGLSANYGSLKYYHVDAVTGHVVPNAYICYSDGIWRGYSYGANVFAGISKFEDGSRIDEKTDQGNRDGILARTGETYLIKAEALVRQGYYQQAIDVINILRARAQYKSGEARNLHSDGSQAFLSDGSVTQNNMAKAYLTRNSYYESTGIPQTTAVSDLQIASYATLPAVDEAILTKLAVAGDYDRMLHFILNERTRELDGEFLRWDDLSRTKTLILRATTFNPQVPIANITEKHYLRPIPQSFIDGLLNPDGTNLTDAQKKAMQNPGY